MNKYLKSSQGFTLVEVIISIAILSVTSVVALQLFITAQNLNAHSRHSDIASVLATNTIETIKSFNNTPQMSASISGLTRTATGFTKTTFFDSDFNVLINDSDETSRVYALNCQLTATDQEGLYTVDVNLHLLEEADALVSYSTAHYFNEEVTINETP